jgi:MFS transporter, ACS family, hexuronate transporter
LGHLRASVCGKLIDKLGARIGYAVCMTLWTLAHVAHAFVNSIGGFIAVRFALGLGESGNFPAGLKAIAEWFPQRERALATGIFTAGSNIGAIVTPLIVPGITMALGWRASFVITGSFSLIWLVVWLKIYRRPDLHPRVSAEERALIDSDPPRPDIRISWRQLLRLPETWAFTMARFLIDPIWWMFLFWLPDFFAKRYGLDLRNFGPPLVVVYAVSDVGSVAGGWLSSKLIRNGMSVNKARKLTMLLASVLVLPVMFAMYANNLWLAVAIVGAATAGMMMAKYAGWVLDGVGSYTPIFIVAGTVYLLALATIHWLSPRMEVVTLA